MIANSQMYKTGGWNGTTRRRRRYTACVPVGCLRRAERLRTVCLLFLLFVLFFFLFIALGLLEILSLPHRILYLFHELMLSYRIYFTTQRACRYADAGQAGHAKCYHPTW